MNQEKTTTFLKNTVEKKTFVESLLSKMTLDEKIGQMYQLSGDDNVLSEEIVTAVKNGEVGSILNDVNPDHLREIQRIAREESRLGIPLVIARDVIHGFQTMMPIPLGQAATWNPEVVRKGAAVAASEAASVGINWTFAPMIDISRDPRWGRIAETLGEDPYLASQLGVAMIEGFQGDDLSNEESIAACAKHFAGYGYAEAGRDYAYVNVGEHELHNVILPPFKAAVEAGSATFMTSFGDLNGIPASGHEDLLKNLLREQWQYDGMVVSDWESIKEMINHGFAADEKHAGLEALRAGVDMEMVSETYRKNIADLIQEGQVSIDQINQSVRYILGLKYDLGLFNEPKAYQFPEKGNPEYLDIAKVAALESIVLLKNNNKTLPLDPKRLKNLAIIGPMADDGYEQMGTWTFDGVESWVETPDKAIRELVGDQIKIHSAKGLQYSRDESRDGFPAAIAAAMKSDAIIYCVGEEAILSGEAHCRADINLPGIQDELLEELAALGKPIILVVMAGRPLTLQETEKHVDALLYAWHPGTMGGSAIADLIFGKANPSGKLPVTFPRMVGQIPIYYNQRNSGRPADETNFTPIEKIEVRAFQTSLGNVSMHIDAGYTPLYPFGFGLSYTTFEYKNIRVDRPAIQLGETIKISAELSNTGEFSGTETSQLYIRDLVGSITRPIKELKGFQKHTLAAGETIAVEFELHTDDLAFYNRYKRTEAEPGDFEVWIGGDSHTTLKAAFEILKDTNHIV